MAQKSPAFRFYTVDFLYGTRDFTTEQIGAYLLLLCEQWDRGFIENSSKNLKKITKISSKKLQKVLEKFEKIDEKKLQNARLEIEREKQEAFSDVQRRKMEKRWSKKNEKELPKTDTGAYTESIPAQGIPSVSVSASASDNNINIVVVRDGQTTTPTLNQVQEYFFAIGSDSTQAQKFFDYNSDRNWMVGKSKIKNWQSFADKWKNTESKVNDKPSRKLTRAERMADDQKRIMEFAAGADMRPPSEN